MERSEVYRRKPVNSGVVVVYSNGSRQVPSLGARLTAAVKHNREQREGGAYVKRGENEVDEGGRGISIFILILLSFFITYIVW